MYPPVNGIWCSLWTPGLHQGQLPIAKYPLGSMGRCPLEGFPFMFMKVLSSALDRKATEFIVHSSCILGASAQNEFDIFRFQGVIEENMRMRPLVLKLRHMPRIQISQFSHSVVSDSLRPHGLQHTRPPCPSLTPEAC